jgi:NADPH:quinone reductase-like Zn-dependent oxidoreductase
VPIPSPRRGEVLIKVAAFGVNRSELHTRLGLAKGVTFPRIPGIEATGTVSACPGGEFQVGQQVATMMGGMGRTFDGGYAEYTYLIAPLAALAPRGSRCCSRLLRRPSPTKSMSAPSSSGTAARDPVCLPAR